jgi:DnaK suppressor protein
VATAAKKQAGKPATNSAKKAAPQAKPVAVKAPVVTKVASPGKTGGKPASAKPAPAGKPGTPKPKAAVPTPAKTRVEPATVKAKAAVKPVQVPEPAAATKPAKPMKTTQSKPTSAKPAKKAIGLPLSDAALLAMPERDYMNEAQLAYFKAKLEGMRDEILENARETGEHLKENEVFADPNDRATVEEENLLEQRVRDRERKLLKKITASLARIEDGSYGFCLETGDPIGIPRLLARPTAELSIEAQEKHERLEKLYAD